MVGQTQVVMMKICLSVKKVLLWSYTLRRSIACDRIRHVILTAQKWPTIVVCSCTCDIAKAKTTKQKTGAAVWDSEERYVVSRFDLSIYSSFSDVDCGMPQHYYPNTNNLHTYWAYLKSGVTVTNTLYGTHYTYTCRDSYVNFEDRTSTELDLVCTARGSWQFVDDSFCIRKYCTFDWAPSSYCPGDHWRQDCVNETYYLIKVELHIQGLFVAC